MAITIKNNQSLGFNVSADPCCFNGRYCQPIQTSDSCYIQMGLTALNNNNLVPQGEFDASSLWTLGAGWSIGSDKLSATNISGTTATSNYLGLTAERLYLIQIELTVTNVGSATVGQGWRIKVNGDYLQLPNNINLGNGYNASLTASWMYRPTSITTDVVEFSTDESTIDFEIAYVKINEVSTPGLALYNSDSQIEEDLTSLSSPNGIKYTNGGGQVFIGSIKSVLYIGSYNYNAVSITCNIYIDSWASITSYIGCGYLMVYDIPSNSNRVRNGNFNTDLSFWTVGAQWSHDGAGKAYYNPPALPYVAGTLTQNIYLLGGYEYDFSFFLSQVGINGDCNVSIDYQDGNGSVLLGTFTGVGTQTATIDLTAFTGQMYITLNFYENTPEEDFKIDTVVIQLADKVGQETDCLDIKASHDCTIKLYATNDDNAFGFDYSVAYAHTLRVKGRIDLSGYPEEKDQTRFSNNMKRLLYAHTEKEYVVAIGDAPEYIHDCIRQMRLHDTFTIDADSYIVSGDYELRTRKTSTNRQATFSVKDVEGIGSNYSCS
jgi:hypothetical protein